MDAVLPAELEQIEKLGGADLVIGVLEAGTDHEWNGLAGMAREIAGEFTGISRAVVIRNNGAGDFHAPAENGTLPAVFVFDLPPPTARETPRQHRARGYESVFAAAEKLHARACGVIASQFDAVTAQWARRLLRPVLELGYDLAAPKYTRKKMEGLLNRAIISPLYGALYGAQVHNPMGPDFGLSGRLLQNLLAQNGRPQAAITDLAAPVASTAACSGLQICETYLGARAQTPTDWTELGGLLAEVLGHVFLDMERKAVWWQKIRGQETIPAFGSLETPAAESAATDVARMVESFQLGARNLQEVWSVVLPPATLLEVKKLSRLETARFRMPDELWVRIIYDFALAHRLRAISRDHLLRSLTPLYLGWIASYALEMEAANAAEVEERLERLRNAFGAGKPYLVSRWRWPDRFSP
jgi:hypothetical protein